MTLQQFVISSQSILCKPIENWLRKRRQDNIQNILPVWIIGAPRSGTTLTYQLLCKYFEAYYLTNRVAKRYRISLVTRIVERFFYSNPPAPASFESKFGNTQAPGDPHEGGQFFYQFFPKEDPYAASADISESQNKNFRNIIEAISYPQALFISKNTFHSLRIQVLAEVFPQSAFIWVRREIESTVYSILKAREKLNIPDEEWWGIKPPGWEEMQDQSTIDKTIWQVRETENIIETDLKNKNAAYLEVTYRQVCEDPMEVLKEIEQKFGLAQHRRKDRSFIPDSFSYSTSPEDELAKKIKQNIK